MLNISDDYLVGFTEGEGMFYIGIVPSKETTSGWQVIYFFKVSQNPSGKVVLDYLKQRLECGYLKENSKIDPTDKSLAYVVRNLNDLTNRVIPFFENKLIIKRYAFERFKEVVELVNKGEHLKRSGIQKILVLAYSMNTQKRKYSKEQILKTYKD